MPTVEERLKHVTLKIERAKLHSAELQRQSQAFLVSTPYKVPFKYNEQTHKLFYYLASADPTPDDLPLIAGDILQNLMSALDHLACQLVCSDTSDNPPNPSWIYFPIADDLQKYEEKKTGKMREQLQRHSPQSMHSNRTKREMMIFG